MTTSNFLTCFTITESFEGGFVNNPHDPGGATMAGVTQATYSKWRAAMHLSPEHVSLSTPEERQDIYRMYYWDPVRGDLLFAGLDLVMADTAWGSGPVKAIKLLQQGLGVSPDGVFDEATKQATSEIHPESWVVVINGLCTRRLAFFKSLATWRYFGHGWTTRLDAIQAHALQMVSNP